jgi:hypothetical protein
VDFIILTGTDGTFGRSTLLPVSAEVDSLRNYYLGELHLPGMLAIEDTHFDTLPDGRRGSATESKNTGYGHSVVTADGKVWSFGGGLLASKDWEMGMAMFIRNHVIGGTHPQVRSSSRPPASP